MPSQICLGVLFFFTVNSPGFLKVWDPRCFSLDDYNSSSSKQLAFYIFFIDWSTTSWNPYNQGNVNLLAWEVTRLFPVELRTVAVQLIVRLICLSLQTHQLYHFLQFCCGLEHILVSLCSNILLYYSPVHGHAVATLLSVWTLNSLKDAAQQSSTSLATLTAANSVLKMLLWRGFLELQLI